MGKASTTFLDAALEAFEKSAGTGLGFVLERTVAKFVDSAALGWLVGSFGRHMNALCGAMKSILTGTSYSFKQMLTTCGKVYTFKFKSLLLHWGKSS